MGEPTTRRPDDDKTKLIKAEYYEVSQRASDSPVLVNTVMNLRDGREVRI